ncbi:disease resistance protein [Striga asiatica]|uniref:Disease resistance protein n=1 Tax=Striga asiatica TaxID=4170 RepID=A0A5A7RAB4_STRAF|nr:disease resistance protein [Striga asiatica]
MAAYAAVLSLTHIIKQLQHHPSPPISLDNQQVQSLTHNLTFLQHFLEGYSHGGGETLDALEGRIADSAHAAEDIIESHIVDRIELRCTRRTENADSIVDLVYRDLQRVIHDMGSILQEVLEFKEKFEISYVRMQANCSTAAKLSSSRSRSSGQNAMVGFDEVLIEAMDKLTSRQPDRQIITVSGMGGIGKTTLAKSIYENPLIKYHFDILAWATISQVYSVSEICLEILYGGNRQGREVSSVMHEHDLGDKLRKSLWGRRYLVVMDDMWSVKVWDKVKFFFPDNNNGSRIMITTRLSHVAFQLSCSSCRIMMNLLDDNRSWDLLCESAFGGESCPDVELEGIGKKIARNCRGLPLSIIVIGGFLAKSPPTRQHWEYIAQNLSSIVNSEDGERCLKILDMSYNELPVHLKPCFLHMGIFSEDAKIRVSSLIKLWVSEGFLKPVHGKCPEMAAEDYLKDLIDRNLVLVHKLGSTGTIKYCKIHDLVRDLCLRKVQKERFVNIVNSDYFARDGTSNERRICVPASSTDINFWHLSCVFGWIRNLQVRSLARTLIGDINHSLNMYRFKLLRVWRAFDTNFKPKSNGTRTNLRSKVEIFQLVNLRYLAIRLLWNRKADFPYVVHIWNLETLIVSLIEFTEGGVTVPYRSALTPLLDIWKMPLIRHVEFTKLDLVDPSETDGEDGFVSVLENLQTLRTVRNFKCTEEVVRRIPNVRKLGLLYEELEDLSFCCLNNIRRLNKLESFACSFFRKRPCRSYLVQNLIFPCSLIKLTLQGTELRWEDMALTTIGTLPYLQVLKLKFLSFVGFEWVTVEGQFRSLEYLLIDSCDDLKSWKTDSTHFPQLKHIVLRSLSKLKEIPLSIGDITTLESIELEYCSESAVFSAKDLVEEQVGLGNEGLRVRAQMAFCSQELQRLSSQPLHKSLCATIFEGSNDVHIAPQTSSSRSLNRFAPLRPAKTTSGDVLSIKPLIIKSVSSAPTAPSAQKGYPSVTRLPCLLVIWLYSYPSDYLSHLFMTLHVFLVNSLDPTYYVDQSIPYSS